MVRTAASGPARHLVVELMDEEAMVATSHQ